MICPSPVPVVVATGAESAPNVSIPPEYEVTEVVCLADVGGALDGKHFIIHDEAGSVGVCLALEPTAIAQTNTITTLSAEDSLAGASMPGLGFVISSGNDDVIGYWFHDGAFSENQPDWSANNVNMYRAVGLIAATTAADVAARLVTEMEIDGFVISEFVGNSFTATALVTGPLAASVEKGGALLSEAIGVDATEEPDGVNRVIMVEYDANLSADNVAVALQTAMEDAAEFGATRLGEAVTITSTKPGTRADASDVDTGFTVTTLVQGR
jgi:hypothetical protein